VLRIIGGMSEVELLRYLMDEAFEGPGIEESNESQSLMANLATVDEASWRARPAGSTRSIESIVLHVGTCKLMYADYAFGPGRLDWGTPEVQPWPEGEAPIPDALDWLQGTHASLMAQVARLSDPDLQAPRLANWGEQRETRWLLSMLLQHDAYHAGEINHIRSLLSGEDRWRWQIDTEGG
jgi:uncharacterized damage-inducible protein DinB